MAARRKRHSPNSDEPRAARPRPSRKSPEGGEPPLERRCWLCSEPLTSGNVTSLFGGDALEVHRRCYERAMKS